jgi:hypothetical protein
MVFMLHLPNREAMAGAWMEETMRQCLPFPRTSLLLAGMLMLIASSAHADEAAVEKEPIFAAARDFLFGLFGLAALWYWLCIKWMDDHNGW